MRREVADSFAEFAAMLMILVALAISTAALAQ